MTPSFDGMLPIREVARLTGVNAVTLRAWERRYGLIEPHRTEKGHRLYTQANLEEVRAILTWLARGVNVGQVKGLLEQPASSNGAEGETPLGSLREKLLEALQGFDMTEFEERLDRSRARYGSNPLCAQVFEPVLDQLHQRWQGQFGSQLEEVFFHGWLRSQLSAWIDRQDAMAGHPRVIIANLSAEHCEPGMWLLAALLAGDRLLPQLLEWEFPASELGLMLDHTPAAAAVFYSSQALPSHQLRRHLPRLSLQLPGRIFIAGPAAAIHAEQWQALGVTAIGTRPSTAHRDLVAALAGDAA